MAETMQDRREELRGEYHVLHYAPCDTRPLDTFESDEQPTPLWANHCVGC